MKALIRGIFQTLSLGVAITAKEAQALKQEVVNGDKAQADKELADIKSISDGIAIGLLNSQLGMMKSCQRTTETISQRHQQSACRLFLSINDKAQLSIVESSDTEAKKQLKIMNEAYVTKLNELTGVNGTQSELITELRDYIETLESSKAQS